MIWDQGKVHKSTDGVNWVTSDVKIDGAAAGWWMNMTIAYNPTSGTYAGVLNAWGNYYEKQKFYRSTDGVNWTTLASTQYKGGHPLGYMTTGLMDSAYCPSHAGRKCLFRFKAHSHGCAKCYINR